MLQVLKADPVVTGVEIGSGKKQKTSQWGVSAHPLKTESTVLDEMAEEQLLAMEQAVITRIGAGQ